MKYSRTIAVVFLLASLGACSDSSAGGAAPVTDPSDVAADSAVTDQVDTGPAIDVVVGDAAADTTIPSGKHPNFVIFVGEAIGWTGTSVQLDPGVPSVNNTEFQTPNLDEMAQNGARFSHFYAASPRCMPTRAALFSGQSPARLHMTFIPADASGAAGNGTVTPPTTVTDLPTSTPTIASYLKTGGYATAHYGKWHAGNTPPEQYGYDVSDGPTSNTGPGKVKTPNPVEVYGMTDRAIAFIEQAVKDGKPFYVHISNYNARDTTEVTADSLAKVQQLNPTITDAKQIGLIAGGLDFDINIGRIRAKLKELGVDGNTYTVYTSDHGGQDNWSNAPLAENKGTVWEGGIRVPLIWDGPTIPAGMETAKRATTVDIFRTFATLSGLTTPLPDALEGGDLTQLLEGDGNALIQRPYEPLVIHFPHYDHDPLGPASAILLGDYKFVRFYQGNLLKLFDLSKDMSEKNDLSTTMPDKMAALDAAMQAYLLAVNAQMPTVK